MKFAIVLCLFGLALSENLHGRTAFGSSYLSQDGLDPGYGTNIGYLPNLGYGANLPHTSTLGYGTRFGHRATLGYQAGQGINGWQGYGSRFNAFNGYNGNGLTAFGTNSA
ncbi:PREDICTED: keratin-associated protein 19-4-like [Papilio xuthus]|uniref:Keratin-associated protein 19-4-like n=1 Tax=Papilio xuthus TaxID=66420 RepID=A0AAJ7EE21_PAPXU|nr:PREDICTED: keratin-associated protein 19-4-like [Papilio xuthus]